MIPEKTIERLSLYRRLLNLLRVEGKTNVYSHQLAAVAGVSAAQVRRDLMVIGYNGSSVHGYGIEQLIACLGRVLDGDDEQHVALVGVGHLGRALINYFSGRRPKLAIVAAFDNDPNKVNRVIHGCRSYPLHELQDRIREFGITLGIIAVPSDSAQDVADQMIKVGVRGLLNFAPMPLRVPPEVKVEDMDITTSLEKVAYFARQSGSTKEAN